MNTEDLAPLWYIRKSVEAFSLPSIELLNYEADDLIATYSKNYCYWSKSYNYFF